MKDLTNGSINRHILAMAVPIAIGMLTQMAYQLVDLYFVNKIGVTAVAGVNTAGNAMFIVMALTQVLGVGTVALIAQAVGRKDQPDANLVFNQSVSLSVFCGLLTMAVITLFMRPYLSSVASDEPTIEAGATFMYWMLPGFLLMFPMTAVGSALRGTGIVQPTIVIQMLTVLINAILAPILIAGWLTGHPYGVAGAGAASTISILIGTILLGIYFHRLEHYVAIRKDQLSPQLKQWRRMLNIGLPAGGEFALMFLYTAIVYYVIRDFGSSAQAGFGIGARVLQAIVLPAMAIAFAAGPIAGQNYGARNSERVRETFRKSAIIGSVVMLVLTLITQISPTLLVSAYDQDAEALAVAALFLQMVSWNYIAQGLVFTCSSVFQGLGNTVPSLLSSGSRLILFAVPAIWISTQPNFTLEKVWYLSIFSSTLQAVISLLLLRVEFKRRLGPIDMAKQAVPAAS